MKPRTLGPVESTPLHHRVDNRRTLLTWKTDQWNMLLYLFKYLTVANKCISLSFQVSFLDVMNRSEWVLNTAATVEFEFMRIEVKVALSLRLYGSSVRRCVTSVLTRCYHTVFSILQGVTTQCSVYYQKSFSAHWIDFRNFVIPRFTYVLNVYFGFASTSCVLSACM
jgi:hypothetical protein